LPSSFQANSSASPPASFHVSIEKAITFEHVPFLFCAELLSYCNLLPLLGSVHAISLRDLAVFTIPPYNSTGPEGLLPSLSPPKLEAVERRRLLPPSQSPSPPVKGCSRRGALTQVLFFFFLSPYRLHADPPDFFLSFPFSILLAVGHSQIRKEPGEAAARPLCFSCPIARGD